MSSDSLEQLLDELDEAKRSFGTDDGARVEKLLASLARHEFSDVESLIRFHEALLFICAYPQSRKALQLAEAVLSSFADRCRKASFIGQRPYAI